MAEFSWPSWLPNNAEASVGDALELTPEEFAAADSVREQQLNDRYLAGRRQILNDGEGAYYRKQGEAAIHAALPTVEALQRLKSDTLAQAGNESQRLALGQRLDDHHSEAMQGLSRHLDEQGKIWRATVAEGELRTAEAEAAANHNDLALVARHATDAHAAVMRTSGETEPEAAQARAAAARSGVWRGAIEAALMSGDSRSAIRLYDRAKDELTLRDAKSMRGQTETVTQRVTAQSWLADFEATKSDAPAPLLDAPRPLADVDAAHKAATESNDIKWANDPEQRAINQHYIDVLFSKRRRVLARTKADIDNAVKDWITAPRSDGQLQTDLPPPALWIQLSAEEQRALLVALKRNADLGT